MQKIIVNIIPMGLPEDDIIREFNISRFVMNGYVIKILLFSSSNRIYQELKFKIHKPNKLEEKILEVRKILRQQNIQINSSKEILILMRVLLCDMPHTHLYNLLEKAEYETLIDVVKSIIYVFKSKVVIILISFPCQIIVIVLQITL